MGRAVMVSEVKTHLSRIIREVAAGQEYIVTRNGVPCARLAPLERPAKVPLGFVRGRLTEAFFEPLPPEEIVAWEGAGRPGPSAATTRPRRKAER